MRFRGSACSRGGGGSSAVSQAGFRPARPFLAGDPGTDAPARWRQFSHLSDGAAAPTLGCCEEPARWRGGNADPGAGPGGGRWPWVCSGRPLLPCVSLRPSLSGSLPVSRLRWFPREVRAGGRGRKERRSSASAGNRAAPATKPGRPLHLQQRSNVRVLKPAASSVQPEGSL